MLYRKFSAKIQFQESELFFCLEATLTRKLQNIYVTFKNQCTCQKQYLFVTNESWQFVIQCCLSDITNSGGAQERDVQGIESSQQQLLGRNRHVKLMAGSLVGFCQTFRTLTFAFIIYFQPNKIVCPQLNYNYTKSKNLVV